MLSTDNFSLLIVWSKFWEGSDSHNSAVYAALRQLISMFCTPCKFYSSVTASIMLEPNITSQTPAVHCVPFQATFCLSTCVRPLSRYQKVDIIHESFISCIVVIVNINLVCILYKISFSNIVGLLLLSVLPFMDFQSQVLNIFVKFSAYTEDKGYTAILVLLPYSVSPLPHEFPLTSL